MGQIENLKKVLKTNDRKPWKPFLFLFQFYLLVDQVTMIFVFVSYDNFRRIFPMIYDLTRRCVVLTATIVKDSLVLEGAKSRRCVRSHIAI